MESKKEAKRRREEIAELESITQSEMHEFLVKKYERIKNDLNLAFAELLSGNDEKAKEEFYNIAGTEGQEFRELELGWLFFESGQFEDGVRQMEIVSEMIKDRLEELKSKDEWTIRTESGDEYTVFGEEAMQEKLKRVGLAKTIEIVNESEKDD